MMTNYDLFRKKLHFDFDSYGAQNTFAHVVLNCKRLSQRSWAERTQNSMQPIITNICCRDCPLAPWMS